MNSSFACLLVILFTQRNNLSNNQTTTKTKKSRCKIFSPIISIYIGSTPRPATVPTRIATFLVGHPNLNFSFAMNPGWVRGRSNDIPLLKPTVKMDGWNTIVCFWGFRPIFRAFAVVFLEKNHLLRCLFEWVGYVGLLRGHPLTGYQVYTMLR